MKSLTAGYLAGLAFTATDLATIRHLGEASGKHQLWAAQTPEQLESLRSAAVIESTESSNRIEGVVAPEGRVRELVLRSTTPRNRSEQEIAGYRDTLQLIHESHAEMPVTANVVRQLHQRLFSYLPAGGGDWKSTDNDIVERDAEGRITRVRFRPVAAHLTPDAMLQTEQLYSAAIGNNVEPLVLSGLTVLDFLCIHPFRDGNGRMARLLTLLLLYHGGHRVGRYISLERVIEDSKASYYETLEASSQGWHEARHDAMPWLRYYWGMLTRAYRELEERMGTVTGKGSKTERVLAAIGRRIGTFRITDIEQECPDVSRDLIRLVLRDLRDKGVLRPEGTGRGARWVKS